MNEGKILKSDPERRRHKRFIYEAHISQRVTTSDTIRSGKMLNFSKGGIYFESDQRIPPGQEMAFGFASYPDSSGNDANFLFDVKIIWRKAPQDAHFRYGYGGQFLHPVDSNLEDGRALNTGTPRLPFGEIQPERESRRGAHNRHWTRSVGRDHHS